MPDVVPDFAYDTLPGRVVFAAGAAARLGEEIRALGLSRVLFIASPRWRDFVADLSAGLGAAAAGHFDRVVAHTPGGLVDEVAALARERGADGAVAIGGGGAVGLAKTTALLVEGVSAVALPTTYSGSEMTPLIGVTRDGLKRVVRDPRVLPRLVLYDPALTVDLPAALTGASGMNALAHCVEALYAARPVPLLSLMAEEGIRHLSRGLPASARRPDDLEARGQALYGAYLAGVAIGGTGVALHHATCHVLGGSFGLGHGEANAVMLPQAVRFNAPAAPEAIQRVAAAMGVEDAAAALYDLAAGTGAPTSLRQLGVREADLDRAARLVVEHTKYNPRPLERAAVRAMLDDAFHGRRPALSN